MLKINRFAAAAVLVALSSSSMQQEAVRAFDGLLGSQVGSQEGATEQ